MFESAYVWSIILLLGLGTWLVRFSFLGLIGDRELPSYVKRMLNYTAVAVLPGISAPMVINSGSGSVEPLRLIAAAAILIIGVWTQSMMKSIGAGLLIYFGINAFI
ncbi:MAG: AzlD domain-containing protein [Oceanospirillaceae bacterium]|nr:AzlD domain-containing protein [Oceanospirillaceae bacterium]